MRGLRRRAGVPWPGAAHRRKTRTRWWSHALFSHERAREQLPRCSAGLYKVTTGTHSTTVSPNRARSHGRKPAAHTRSRAGIGARKPAAAHSQPAGRARQATMAGRRWRRRRHRTCAPTRPMARPPLGTQKTHSTPSSVTTVSSTGSFRRVATNAPRAARVEYLSQAQAPGRPPPKQIQPAALVHGAVGVHAPALPISDARRSPRTRRRAPTSEWRARYRASCTHRPVSTSPLAPSRSAHRGATGPCTRRAYRRRPSSAARPTCAAHRAPTRPRKPGPRELKRVRALGLGHQVVCCAWN